MIYTAVIGFIGASLLAMGLMLLFKKAVGGTLPPRGPAIALMAVSSVFIAIALWGGKNPRDLERFIRPKAVTCPLVLDARDLFRLTSEQATSFSGHLVEGGWCEYTFEFRSQRKLKGKVDLDPAVRQDMWLQTCGNHPMTRGAAEVWVKKLPDDQQLVCFLTKTFEGAIWLDKDDDGLKWVKTLQTNLPNLVD